MPSFSTQAVAIALLQCASFGAFAQSAPVTGSLVEYAEIAGFNALERAAARANQASYNGLVTVCANGAGPGCSDGDLVVFEETRELVETANELLGSGSTRYSLGLDSQGLGFALRWTAAEEMAGQGSATSRFAASQMSALATRLSVLRWGVSGLRTVNNESSDATDIRLAGVYGARSGAGASADIPEDFPRWGAFVDGSFGYGSKDPTDLEDAFDFDGSEVTVGVDYRFNPALVAGAMFGYSTKEIDFDSRLSIVDGGIESDGFSVLLFGMLEGQNSYLSASIGYQQLQHDTTRRITYPSNNPTIAPVDSTARSDTDSDAILATFNAGYSFRLGAFSVDPVVNVVYSDTTIEAFTETSVSNLGHAGNDPFNLRIGEQSIESFDVAPSLKLQYVFTPKFGVLIPYVVGRYHFQLSDDARVISAQYADALGQLLGVEGTDFAVSTDVPDDEYYTVAGGLSVVLPHGLNGFVQYLEVFDFDAYSDAVITAGFRFEF